MWSAAANTVRLRASASPEWMAGASERDEPVVEQLQHADIRRLNRQALDVDDEMTAAAA